MMRRLSARLRKRWRRCWSLALLGAPWLACGPATVSIAGYDAGAHLDAAVRHDGAAPLDGSRVDVSAADGSAFDASAVDADDLPDAAGADDGAGTDLASVPRPGAPVLANLGAAQYRWLPFDIPWQAAVDDVTRGVEVVRWQVQESTDNTFATGVRSLRVDPPGLRLSRVVRAPAFNGAPRVTYFYRVRGHGAGGAGPFSNIDSKILEATWTPTYHSVGFHGPNAPPYALDGNSFVVDDVNGNNSHGTFAKSGPGWLDTTDPNKGYLGHYWYVSNNAPQPRDGSEGAVWTPTFTRAGRYDVWLGYYRSGNRDNHVEHFVTSADGERLGPFTVDQFIPQPDGGVAQDTVWVKLGAFRFATGTAAHVDLVFSPTGWSHSESADAVGFDFLSR